MKRSTFKRKSKNALPPRYLLLIVTISCIVVMLLSFTLNLSGGPLKVAAGYVFTPMQQGINRVGSLLSDSINNLATLREVQAENEDLRHQINTLTEELNAIQLEQYDVENYRKLLSLDEKYPDYEKVAAHVIGKDTGNWFSTFLIDKGKNDGIEVDMNVIADDGLVGIVTSVGANYAKVRAIVDDISQVSAMVLSTSDLCIVKGDLILMNAEQKLSLTKLKDDDDEVHVGDAVVTSTVSSKYVPGILIGYISGLEYDSNNLTKSGTVTPVVDFEHLQEVLVIKYLKDTSGLEAE